MTGVVGLGAALALALSGAWSGAGLALAVSAGVYLVTLFLVVATGAGARLPSGTRWALRLGLPLPGTLAVWAITTAVTGAFG